MSWTNPQYLVETDWLAAYLDDPALRVLECTTVLHPLPEGGYRAESGRAAWSAGHIPRSGFADLTDDLSARAASLRFMMPPAAEMVAAMARLGMGVSLQSSAIAGSGQQHSRVCFGSLAVREILERRAAAFRPLRLRHLRLRIPILHAARHVLLGDFVVLLRLIEDDVGFALGLLLARTLVGIGRYGVGTISFIRRVGDDTLVRLRGHGRRAIVWRDRKSVV